MILSSAENLESAATDLIELRSRTNRLLREDSGKNGSEKVFVEKKVRSGDSLNKIALQYSVPISEIKRVNGIVADQEIFALSSVKIPITRLRKELNLEHERELLKNDSLFNESDPEDEYSETKRLIPEKNGSVYNSVDELFRKADASVSQVRDNLPNSPAEGAFHFVDASSPESAHKEIWAFIAIILTLFILIPLLLTYFEEHKDLTDNNSTS